MQRTEKVPLMGKEFILEVWASLYPMKYNKWEVGVHLLFYLEWILYVGLSNQLTLHVSATKLSCWAVLQTICHQRACMAMPFPQCPIQADTLNVSHMSFTNHILPRDLSDNGNGIISNDLDMSGIKSYNDAEFIGFLLQRRIIYLFIYSWQWLWN